MFPFLFCICLRCWVCLCLYDMNIVICFFLPYGSILRINFVFFPTAVHILTFSTPSVTQTAVLSWVFRSWNYSAIYWQTAVLQCTYVGQTPSLTYTYSKTKYIILNDNWFVSAMVYDTNKVISAWYNVYSKAVESVEQKWEIFRLFLVWHLVIIHCMQS